MNFFCDIFVAQRKNKQINKTKNYGKVQEQTRE